MWKLFILGLVALATAEQASFENYKVFRINPTDQYQVNVLQGLEEYAGGYSFWKGPSYVNHTVDLMVPPEKIPEFMGLMRNIDVDYKVYIDNVQNLIRNEKSLLRSSEFDFTSYHTLDEIYRFLDKLAQDFPDNVEVIVGGNTYEDREIKGVKVSFGKEKPGIFIEGGIHAREWISPATVLYLLNQLLHSKDKDVRDLAESHDWYIFPVFNPDGYVYTHTKNRLWRKSRHPAGVFCSGVDLNRNFPYKWMEGGASSNPCAETYAGSAPASEPEINSMTNYIKSISDKFYAYISFHSYSQLLLFPYGHTTAHLENYDQLYTIGKATINALSKKYGTKYVTGNIAETIYVATGSSVDWVKGDLKKPISYTYELRDTGKHGFLLPANQIIPTGEETLDSFIAMFRAASKLGYPNTQ